MSLRVYPGTYAQYQALPDYIKKWYSPPPPTQTAPKPYIPTAPSTTVSPVVYRGKPVISDVGISPEPLTPQQEAEVQAIINAPEGLQLVSVEKDYVQTPAQIGREDIAGTPVYVATYKEPEAPKSIGEQIAEFNPAQFGADLGERIFGKVEPQQKEQLVTSVTETMGSGIPGIKGTPTQVIGGIVSTFEAPVYAVAGLAGIKGLPQPKTTSGALIGSGIASVTTGKLTATQEYQWVSEHPAYAAGSIAGDIVLAYVTGKAIAKVASPLTSRIASKVSGRLGESYEAASKAGELWKPSLGQKALMKLTGARPSLATGMVDVPLPMQRVGQNLLVEYDVGMDIFEMGIAPKQSLLMMSKVPSGLGGSRLPSYLATSVGLLPKVEIFYYPKEPASKIIRLTGGGETKPFMVEGSTVQVWASQPQRALYQTMPRSYMEGFTRATGKKSVSVGGSGMAPLWESVGASQITKQVSKTVTETQKPYTPTVTKTTPKTITIPSLLPSLAMVERQTTHPFLQYRGKPYHRQRQRETEETIFPTMPGQVNRLLPTQETKRDTQLIPLPTVTPKPSPKTDIFPVIIPETKTIPSEKTIIDTTTKTIPKQPTKTTLKSLPYGFNFPRAAVPKGFGFPSVGGEAGSRTFQRFSGRWYPRKHPVKTWEQMLGTFGVGKVPKGIAKLGRMETPRDLFRQRKKQRRKPQRRRRR